MTRVPADPRRVDGPTWRLGDAPWRSHPLLGPARTRVIVDNDFSGDPDDLVQLVHSLLSPSAEVRLVVASHLRPDDPFDGGPDTAANAEAVVRDVFARMGLLSTEVIVRGASTAMPDPATPRDSAAAWAIVTEALRDDPRPLYYLAGGGLTDLASAVLLEPRVAERLTLVWIGGPEHPGLAVAPPDAMPIEYNLLIDVAAARSVFAGAVPIWQVPRDVYRQCLVSEAELRLRVAVAGTLGAHLYEEIARVMAGADGGETYAIGDSPLVLLSALQSLFEPDPSSSRYATRPTPEITADGAYRDVPGARPMRVYTWVDTRLMVEDLALKLGEFARWRDAASRA